jgi:hypothetical protein
MNCTELCACAPEASRAMTAARAAALRFFIFYLLDFKKRGRAALDAGKFPAPEPLSKMNAYANASAIASVGPAWFIV